MDKSPEFIPREPQPPAENTGSQPVESYESLRTGALYAGMVAVATSVVTAEVVAETTSHYTLSEFANGMIILSGVLVWNAYDKVKKAQEAHKEQR